MKKTLLENIQNYSIPLHTTNDLRRLIDDMKDAKIVLLGESSHGTSEFYKIRS